MEVCKRPAQIYENGNLSGVPANFAGVMAPSAASSNLNITLNNQLNAALHNQVSVCCPLPLLPNHSVKSRPYNHL